MERLLGLKLTGYYSMACDPRPGVPEVCREIAKLAMTGHRNAMTIACALLIKDPKLPCGKRIKIDFAKALKKQAARIPDVEKNGLLNKTVALLNMEFCPHETESYCKLVKSFGSETVGSIVALVNPINEKSKLLAARLRYANGVP